VRRVLVAVVVAALVAAGAFLAAVLWPRDQPDGVTPTPVLVTDTTIAPRPYTVAEVRQAFRQSGLPLAEESRTATGTTGQQMLGVEGLRAFVSERADQVFRVEVYPTAEQAVENRGLILIVTAAGHGPRGQVRDQTKGNVRIVYDEGRPMVRRKFRRALASLG
jgi:hypothetical protein